MASRSSPAYTWKRRPGAVEQLLDELRVAELALGPREEARAQSSCPGRGGIAGRKRRDCDAAGREPDVTGTVELVHAGDRHLECGQHGLLVALFGNGRQGHAPVGLDDARPPGRRVPQPHAREHLRLRHADVEEQRIAEVALIWRNTGECGFEHRAVGDRQLPQRVPEGARAPAHPLRHRPARGEQRVGELGGDSTAVRAHRPCAKPLHRAALQPACAKKRRGLSTNISSICACVTPAASNWGTMLFEMCR